MERQTVDFIYDTERKLNHYYLRLMYASGSLPNFIELRDYFHSWGNKVRIELKDERHIPEKVILNLLGRMIRLLPNLISEARGELNQLMNRPSVPVIVRQALQSIQRLHDDFNQLLVDTLW